MWRLTTGVPGIEKVTLTTPYSPNYDYLLPSPTDGESLDNNIYYDNSRYQIKQFIKLHEEQALKFLKLSKWSMIIVLYFLVMKIKFLNEDFLNETISNFKFLSTIPKKTEKHKGFSSYGCK